MSTQIQSLTAAQDESRRLAWLDSWVVGALLAGALLGGLLAGAPRALVLAVALASAALLVVALGGRSSRTFLHVLAVLLGGYIFFGRGLAHLGMKPLHVSEFVLLLGLAFFFQRSRFLWVLRSPVTWALIANALWGVACTLPYLGVYGADALRDGVVWGYSAFALLVCAFLLENGLTEQAILRFFRPLLWPIAAFVNLINLVRIFRPDVIPHTSGGVPLFEVRPADLSIHLAGAFAFFFLGLHRYGSKPRVAGGRLLWFTVWSTAFVLVAAQQRGAMLIVCGALAILVLDGNWRRWVLPVVAGSLLLGTLAISGFRADLGKGGRTLSAEQLTANLKSIVGIETQRGMAGTKDWRIVWWRQIADYTFSGPYFLTGKGYGVNLAEQAFKNTKGELPLRHPHNAHFNILARSGVPGLALWLLTQGVFLFVMVRAFLVYRMRGMDLRRRLTLFIGTYWAACQIMALSNGMLISPQTGIWFWSIIGAGMALATEARTASVQGSAALGLPRVKR